MAVKSKYPSGGRPEGEPSTGGAEPRLYEESGMEEDAEKGAPEGFDSEADFLQYWSKCYTDDYDADKHNIDEAVKDLEFIYVDHWDPEVRAQREDEGRPCMTINTLPQMIGQVIGDRRINKVQIKVLPDHNGSVEEAQFRAGLIRSIENYSRAERVYDAACEDQVGGGVSNLEVLMDYARNDAFAQDVMVQSLANPFAVVWDRFSLDPTGKDAKHCFVEDVMSRKQFEKDYPESAIPTTGFGDYQFGEEQHSDDVKILALWQMVEKPATFALMQDGGVKDVTGQDPAEYAEMVMINEEDGQPYVREGARTYARRYLVTSFAILEGPYELPLSRVPIIKVSGRIGRVGTKRYRFGLVRWARDPSLMRDYWRSKAVETLAMTPASTWIADHASVKGREDDFRNAHLTGDPLLVYNTGKNEPKRVDPPEVPVAFLNETAMNAQDIKDVTGIHDASLGIRSNEVSGRAIAARQREGDVATVMYHDNLNQAIQEVGCVINELIPICYDTARIVRVMGPDDVPEFKRINDARYEDSFDITDGKYDIQVVTGPSFTTQRQEGAELLLELAKVNPALFEVAGDVMMETQDIPGGERIAARLRKILPAAQQEEAERQQASGQEQEPSPEQQMAAQTMQMQQQMAEAQMQMQMAEMEAKVAEAQAKAQLAAAQARKAELEVEQAEEQIRIMRAKAEEGEAKAVIAEEDIERQRREHVVSIAEKRTRAKQDIQQRGEKHGTEMRRGEESHAVGMVQKLNPPDRASGSSSKSGGGSRSAGGSLPKKGKRT